MQAKLQKSIKGIKLGNQGCSFTHLFLLMIPCFSSKMIKTPVVTLKESLIGTVISLDNTLTIINLIYIALQTCLRRNKCPSQNLQVLSRLQVNTWVSISSSEEEELLTFKTWLSDFSLNYKVGTPNFCPKLAELLLFLLYFKPCPFTPFPALGSLKLFVRS